MNLAGAHGLLYAFDSLYVMVNERGTHGLYRVRDTDGDDRYDEVKLLREIKGGGEHGMHSIVLSPDGKSLYVVCGNSTELTKVDRSRVPLNWGEDNLATRIPTGFMDDSLAPQGWIARTDPDGKEWELIAAGMRNPFDIAFNRDGELFTYDADMEWDIGEPWYRPTRVNHVISGAEFGFRNGSGKWPAYYIDSFGAVVDIGPGSPTGITFGYGAKFPEKYRDALFISDWSFGKLRAVHLRPEGASYTAEVEEFLSGQPLPVTDVVINPKDGAMYLAVGGRGAQSALYRVTYVRRRGRRAEPARPPRPGAAGPAAEAGGLPRAPRRERGRGGLALPGRPGPGDPLRRPDRPGVAGPVAVAREGPERVRPAQGDRRPGGARPRQRQGRAPSQADRPDARPGPAGPDPGRPGRDRLVAPGPLRSRRPAARLLAGVHSPGSAGRRGVPAAGREVRSPCSPRRAVGGRLPAGRDPRLPPGADGRSEDHGGPARGPDAGGEDPVRARAPRPEGGLDPAAPGGVLPLVRHRGRGLPGRQHVRQRAADDQDPGDRDAERRRAAALKPILDARPARKSPRELLAARKPVKEWTLAELVPIVERGLGGRHDLERGRRLYGAVACAACHRFGVEGGGVGPDLTAVAGRFGVRDLLEAIVEPSKVISDQYAAVSIATKDGRIVTGRVGNIFGDSLSVIEDMFDPGRATNVRRARHRGDEAVGGLPDARRAAQQPDGGGDRGPGRLPPRPPRLKRQAAPAVRPVELRVLSIHLG